MFFANCGFVQAQHSAYVGVKGGYHVATVNMSHTILRNTVPTSQVFGSLIGVTAKLFPKPHYGLQWELNYSRKGFDQRLTDTNEEFRTTFDYLEFPFLFNLYLGKRKTQYFANFGPFGAVLLNDKTTGPTNSLSEQLDFIYNSERDNKFAFGLKVAVGIFREFSFGGIQIDGHFTAEISNFLDPVDLSTGVPDNSQNFTLGATVAYLIPLGTKFDDGE